MKKFLITLCCFMLIGCQQPMNENLEGSTTIEESTNEVVPVEDEVSVEEQVMHLTDDLIDMSYPMSIIKDLSSEKYQGRQAGTAENELAEDYLVDTFKTLGIQSPEGLEYKQIYTQKAIMPVKPTEITFEGSELTLAYQVDFTERFYGGVSFYDAEFTADMVVITEENQLKENIETLNDKVLLVTDDLRYSGDLFSLLQEIQDNGIHIKAVCVGNEAVASGLRAARGLYFGQEIDETDPVLFNIRKTKFEEMILLAEQGVQMTVSMDFTLEDVEVANIVGYIEGKNETGDDETLIIGGHMDHIGSNLDGTYLAGALDNASGTSVVLEMARILSQGEQPEDDVIFVLFNGEEDGLLGSEYFVSNPPVEYDAKHTRMLNLDMVGSVNDVPLELAKTDKNLSMQRSLIDICKSLDIDYKLSNNSGSDHTNFSNQGVESVMLIHFDHEFYHTTGDTYEQAISESRLEDVVKIALRFVNEEVYE